MLQLDALKRDLERRTTAVSTRVEDRLDRLEALVLSVTDARITSAESAAATDSAALSERVVAIQAALAVLLERSSCGRSVAAMPEAARPEAAARALLAGPGDVREDELTYS
jgi:hypothetical protein